jgi:hypothetical protein
MLKSKRRCFVNAKGFCRKRKRFLSKTQKGVDRQSRSPRPSVGCLSIAKAIADHPLFCNDFKLIKNKNND